MGPPRSASSANRSTARAGLRSWLVRCPPGQITAACASRPSARSISRADAGAMRLAAAFMSPSMSLRLRSRTLSRKCRLGTADMPRSHSRATALRLILDRMNTGAEPDQEAQGQLIALPAAPDAIELRHLRSFVAVAEELNFSRA